ncbi:MAG: hypothetical protein J7L71_06585 [Spirochaetaceae bacterium]|nr:hypothetical protein [Spirochaetaceae bacterium]
MKWTSHKIITFSAVYLLTDSLPAGIISALGAVFPDVIEGRYRKKTHRRLSHWCVTYFVVCIAVYVINLHSEMQDIFFLSTKKFFSWFIKNENEFSFSAFSYFVFWFSVGCIFHILEDALTGKVPFLNPQKRTFGIYLFRVGSFAEKVLIILIGMILLIVKIF